MIERVLVAGGGTGGHLFPGIAVVEELRRRNPELQVLFVGTERGIENRVLPKLGEKLELIDVKPLLGRSPLQLVKNLSLLPMSATQALSLLRTYKPQLVIGLGGYAAGPMLLAAAGMRIPTALLEQNAHVGFTNRMLARIVGRAYLTYAETASLFGAKARVLGNPVRRSFVEAANLASHDPAGVEARARRVLVIGGSQGAKTLNEVVPMALALANVSAQGVAVLHQTGEAQLEEVRKRYRGQGVDAEVVSFIDDMPRAYASASLVIGRAGATTLAELCAIGKPSILIPYPHAAEDHQAKNAFAMERAGAALSIREHELTAEGLASEVRELLRATTKRRSMADAARKLGRPDAAAAIVDDLYAWLGMPVDGTLDSDVTSSSSSPSSGTPQASGSVPPSADAEAAGVPARRISRRPKVRRAELRVKPLHALHVSHTAHAPHGTNDVLDITG
ncbi:MAG TPA: undecaprenyldiphospho-muramoylpentapeptide beta-N-acetylglucosaminyltransferase [Polyangiales bacterium]|jgi:UDP-N-acetylglucosamine--N-acetylmuramyl-(pentapeptide) pyrophosphoryl-undecaprenol N-acetylglucosamine transferase|nr:undecaprenyldiphospho-muramoylpentapeptide beta-N-acetylglucosaminyltransferase [Polyangiales bacterium]